MAAGAYGLSDGSHQPPAVSSSVRQRLSCRRIRSCRSTYPTNPDHSLKLFDKGFYALGLLYARQLAETERHWMLPLRKGAQYRVVRSLGAGQELVELPLSPQAKKKWQGAADTLTTRLISKELNGKKVQTLTSICDPLRFPKADVVDLYSHRWEIEHGFREMKQHQLNNELMLRSQ